MVLLFNYCDEIEHVHITVQNNVKFQYKTSDLKYKRSHTGEPVDATFSFLPPKDVPGVG